MPFTPSDAQSFAIPGGTEGVLYPPSADGAASIAHVRMDGHYPQKGRSINDLCTETLYMLNGSFTIGIEGEEVTVEKGGVFSIPPKNHYTIRGKGEAIDVITPAWDSKQNHIVE